MKLFIGCSSSEQIPQIYIKDCENYLKELFKLDNTLVFGAYNKGLMAISYEQALNNNKEIITNSISERTEKLIEESDVLIFLPGGIGTIYELLTAIESKRSKEFDKPIIIYNSNHYFDNLLLFLDNIYNQNFTNKSVKNCYHISNNITDTIEYINNYYN